MAQDTSLALGKGQNLVNVGPVCINAQRGKWWGVSLRYTCISFFYSEIWAAAAPGYPGSLVRDALLYSFANTILLACRSWPNHWSSWDIIGLTPRSLCGLGFKPTEVYILDSFMSNISVQTISHIVKVYLPTYLISSTRSSLKNSSSETNPILSQA
jgi:hypothetical protein